MFYARCASQFVGMIFQTRSTLAIENILLLFTHHYPARCFGMNMPKSRDIQAKIPLPQEKMSEIKADFFIRIQLLYPAILLHIR